MIPMFFLYMVHEAAAKANNSLSVLSNWFVANKLSLSIDITSYCIFGKCDDQKHNVTLQLYNMNIKRVNCS